MNIKGIGTDLAKISRIEKLINRYDTKQLNYLYTDNEIQFCKDQSNPYLNYTLCYSLKEAVGKTLGIGLGGLLWNEIEVVPTPKGNITINLFGKALERKNLLDITHWMSYWSTIDDMILSIIIAT